MESHKLKDLGEHVCVQIIVILWNIVLLDMQKLVIATCVYDYA